MSKSFDEVIMATYAELCVLWRIELVSCRSNAKELNAKLRSLEEVLKAFNLSPDLSAKPETATAEQAPEEDRLKVTTSEILQPRPQSPAAPAEDEASFEFSESDYSDAEAELAEA